MRPFSVQATGDTGETLSAIAKALATRINTGYYRYLYPLRLPLVKRGFTNVACKSPTRLTVDGAVGTSETEPKTFLFRTRKGKPRGITATTDSCVCQKCPNKGFATKTQPMIPAQDRSRLHVFAGTWQSPANL